MAQRPAQRGNRAYLDQGSPLDGLRPQIRIVVERKRSELKLACQGVDQQINSYYPPNLHRQAATGRADRDDIGRKSYSNDIISWMALSLYRHWFGQQLAAVSLASRRLADNHINTLPGRDTPFHIRRL